VHAVSRILITYASRHGHTSTIAERIAAALRDAGHEVELVDDADRADPSPRDYDAVIAGASIHGGRHEREIVAWARHHGVTLSMVPSAFFSVCLTMAEDTDESRAAAHDYLDDFEERTGWTPRVRTSFAGALQYRRYGVLTRLVMRVLMKRAGHPTDTGRDYDYTDWDAVDAFAHRCAARAAECQPANP
jgi:menaquinone-dependent protoporphyrinogen oxidase